MKDMKNERIRTIIAWINYGITAIPVFVMIFLGKNILQNLYGFTGRGELVAVALQVVLLFGEILICVPHIVMSIRTALGKDMSIIGTILIMLLMIVHNLAEFFCIFLMLRNANVIELVLVLCLQAILFVLIMAFLVYSVVCRARAKERKLAAVDQGSDEVDYLRLADLLAQRDEILAQKEEDDSKNKSDDKDTTSTSNTNKKGKSRKKKKGKYVSKAEQNKAEAEESTSSDDAKSSKSVENIEEVIEEAKETKETTEEDKKASAEDSEKTQEFAEEESKEIEEKVEETKEAIKAAIKESIDKSDN